MLLSALSFLVVAQSSSEVPEALMNNPVYQSLSNIMLIIQQSQREQFQAIEYCLIQLLQGVQPDRYLTLRQNLNYGRL